MAPLSRSEASDHYRSFSFLLYVCTPLSGAGGDAHSSSLSPSRVSRIGGLGDLCLSNDHTDPRDQVSAMRAAILCQGNCIPAGGDEVPSLRAEKVWRCGHGKSLAGQRVKWLFCNTYGRSGPSLNDFTA